MTLLQTITGFNNSASDCPVAIGKCELKFDAENVRTILRISLEEKEDIGSIYIDICCYNNAGGMLSVMKRVPYIKGGMRIELPSLMTASVAVILREVVYKDGIRWFSEDEFPAAAPEPDSSDTTARFNSSEITEALREEEPQSEPTKRQLRRERRKVRKERIAEEEEIRRIIKKDPTERRKRFFARLFILVLLASAAYGGVYALRYKTEADAVYKKAMNLYNSGKYEEAIPELEKANSYLYLGENKKELYWTLAMGYARQRRFSDAASYFCRLGDYKESRANYRSILNAYSGIIDGGGDHTVGLKSDGTAVAAGSNDKGQCSVSDWNDIIKVTAGGEHTAAINRDNTVVAVGDNSRGQCNVERWTNIVDIAAGTAHTIGVKNTGEAVACGDNTYGQCDIESWSGIISASAGSYHSVGLKIDGTVVAAGSNEYGECNVGDWTDIISVAAGYGFTAGLKADGRVLVAGGKDASLSDAEKVREVFAIASGEYNLLLISKSGQVTSKGGNDSNQGMTALWKNVVAAGGGGHHSVGVCRDGTVFAAGKNEKGQTSLSDWADIGIPKNTVTIRKADKDD